MTEQQRPHLVQNALVDGGRLFLIAVDGDFAGLMCRDACGAE